MTADERQRMEVLCELIQTEQDFRKFTQLILELDTLLRPKNEHEPPSIPPAL